MKMYLVTKCEEGDNVNLGYVEFPTFQDLLSELHIHGHATTATFSDETAVDTHKNGAVFTFEEISKVALP